jgi:hypothetical protein
MTLRISVSDALGNEASKTINDIDVVGQDTAVVARVETDPPTVHDVLETIVLRASDASVFTLKKRGS